MDPLTASRLPDLPNAGYSTTTERELSDAMMTLIRGFERDRYLLLHIVIAGRKKWRKVFIQAFRAIKADDQFADAVFGYLKLLAGEESTWDAQKARLEQYHGQQATRTWDYRLRTLLAQAKDNRALEQDILTESLKAQKHKVFSS